MWVKGLKGTCGLGWDVLMHFNGLGRSYYVPSIIILSLTNELVKVDDQIGPF